MTVRRLLIQTARYGLPALFTILLALYGVGAAIELKLERAEAAQFMPPGKLYDIGGRRLHLYCLGQSMPGQAPVVLVGGSGENFYTWWNLQHQLASSGLVCSYDRSGYGWSEVGPGPRTLAALAEELQALIKAAGLPPPYRLVGHSLGGLIVRQYALDYPEEVQSLVLVDSLDAEAMARLPALFRKPLLAIPALKSGAGAVLQTAGVLRLLDRWGNFEVSPVLARLPDEIKPAARAIYFNPRSLATAAREQAALEASVLSMVPRRLPDALPVISLLASSANGQAPDSVVIRDFEGLTADSQVKVLPEAGNYLYLVAPGAVLDAIWETQAR